MVCEKENKIFYKVVKQSNENITFHIEFISWFDFINFFLFISLSLK